MVLRRLTGGENSIILLNITSEISTRTPLMYWRRIKIRRKKYGNELQTEKNGRISKPVRPMSPLNTVPTPCLLNLRFLIKGSKISIIYLEIKHINFEKHLPSFLDGKSAFCTD